MLSIKKAFWVGEEKKRNRNKYIRTNIKKLQVEVSFEIHPFLECGIWISL